MATHDLHTFMEQVANELSSEYERIRARTAEDPGTAGDEGEEDWAHILREWLPPTYRIVTKGRLLDCAGVASPQVDVIVLRPGYPPKLVDKKVYLLDGVAAAFECKTTLRAEHVHEAFEASVAIRRLRIATQDGPPTPWSELRGGPVYGLLAHSHDWKKEGSKPAENVTNLIQDGLNAVATKPRDLLDVVTIADLGTWTSSVFWYVPRMIGDAWEVFRDRQGLPDAGGIQSVVFAQKSLGDADDLPSPIAVLLTKLYMRIAARDLDLRPIADYFRVAGLLGSGAGIARVWPFEIVPDAVADRIRSGRFSEREVAAWGDWNHVLI